MTDTTTATAPATAAERYDRFHTRRNEVVQSPTGPLALVNTQWVDDEQTIWGVPGTWAPLPAGESGLKLTASADLGIHVDGVLVDGEAIVRGKDAEKPGDVRFDEHTAGFVIAGENGQYALRVWDAQSEAIAEFGEVDAYPYNPDWVVTGRFTPHPEGKTVGFEHMKDGGAVRELSVPGDIALTVEGVEYNLAAFADGRRLQLVFSDGTSGDGTYSVGRFLFVAPNADGTITLDFNYAVLPPCSFSYNFNCPIPPKQNRLPFRIEAGEKNVLAKSGELLHGD